MSKMYGLKVLLAVTLLSCAALSAAEPIKALIITGGCCHDYKSQTDFLKKGISKYANVKFDVIHEGKGTKHVHSIFKKENWTKGYDVIIHNECSANVGDEVGAKVAKEHHDSGVGAVMIHCAFHTFRSMKGEEWRACLGATSYKHTHQEPVKITFDKPDHPIMKGTKEFTTKKEELYIIDKVFDHAEVLATGTQGKHKYPLMFANKYGKAKIFSVTIGHNNHTFTIEEWMHIVAKGMLWACDKIKEDGTAKDGYGPKK